ncbi:MAG: hypothetical protein RLP02_14060 [Coleofasciculus sp. C2-GNP5-27]
MIFRGHQRVKKDAIAPWNQPTQPWVKLGVGGNPLSQQQRDSLSPNPVIFED